MALVSILFFPAMRVREQMRWNALLDLDLPIFLLATGSVLAFYLLSQREVRAGWLGSLTCLPVLMSVGIGLCVNNTRAVLEAVSGWRTEFERTPKLRVEGRSRPPASRGYRGRLSTLTLLELGLGIHFTAVLAYAWMHRIYVSLPFLILFQAGYLYTAFLSLGQWARLRKS
jgi:hypothetical protein